tara:strand:- start:211 stop:516 length:306 start_codon:yes stop_codon:yes gene_type:complete
MKKTINFYDFEKAFVQADRVNQFTYEGKKALFEYLEQYEEDCDIEIELDVIALCCEYAEYANIEEFWLEYFEGDYPDEESIMDATNYYSFGDKGQFIIQIF